jgi:replicative DNA helicase
MQNGSHYTWQELIPVNEAEESPAFPVESMPTWLGQFVRAQSVSTQVPEDMTGMLCLAGLSAAIQGRINAVAYRGTWVEPVTLYVAVAMSPGERKSSIFERITRPLSDWEMAVQDMERPLVAVSQQRQQELEKAVDSADQRVAKLNAALRDLRLNQTAAPDTVRAAEADLTVAQDQAVEARVRLDQHNPMYRMRLVYNDLTPEAAAQALSQQRYERLAIMSDEGGVFDVLTGGRYSDRLNLDVFLKGHSGNRIQVDRVGRDSETIMRPMLTLGLAVQPSVLRDIGKSKQMYGRGLLARFAYAIPDTLIGRRLVMPDAVSQALSDEYDAAMKDVAAAAYGCDQVKQVLLTDEADEALWAFANHLEPRLDEFSGDLEGIVEWSSKEVGLVLRIAACLAVARHRAMPDEIEAEDIEAAVAFAPYLEAHAHRAFGMMGITENAGFEAKLVKWLTRRGVHDFKTRDLLQNFRPARAFKAEELDEILDRMATLGYIRRVVTAEKPIRFRWDVNPALHE